MSVRFKYNKPPLVEVTYQVNFPTILDIEANEPVGFQKRIMEKFPNYDTKTEYQNEVTVNVVDAKADASLNRQQTRRLHFFASEDQQWRITLAKDMLAFTTTDYKYWEDMTARSVEIIKAFIDEFTPMYFTRVGLRYIDAFDRKEIGLEKIPWDELLQPHILGGLSYKTKQQVSIRNSAVSSELIVDDVFINLASGTGFVDRHDGTPPREAFILNCDYYYNQKTSVSELTQIATKLHNQSHTFFRESITDKLHNAMEPEELSL